MDQYPLPIVDEQEMARLAKGKVRGARSEDSECSELPNAAIYDKLTPFTT